MQAWLFHLVHLETGRHTAWAVLCPDARYGSLLFRDVGHPVRRFANGAQWLAITQEFAAGIAPGMLPATGPICQLLAAEVSKLVIVQYVTAKPIDVAPGELVATLDAWMREQAIP